MFDLLDKSPICGTKQMGKKLFEFPLTIPTFAGGLHRSQGPDRVIGISPTPGQGKPRSFTFCLAISHRGGTGDEDASFRPCVPQPPEIECSNVQNYYAGEGRSLNETMVWNLFCLRKHELLFVELRPPLSSGVNMQTLEHIVEEASMGERYSTIVSAYHMLS